MLMTFEEKVTDIWALLLEMWLLQSASFQGNTAVLEGIYAHTPASLRLCIFPETEQQPG